MPDSMNSDLPVDGDHALLVGALAGALMRAKEQEGFDYNVSILDDADGNHLAVFTVSAPSGLYMVRVTKL